MPRTKKSKKGRRYSEAEKKRILAAAKKHGLTGAEVSKRFGVSTLTFYRWRGPVYRKRRNGRAVEQRQLEAKARAEIRRKLPKIIREEMAAYLQAALGRGPGRPRQAS